MKAKNLSEIANQLRNEYQRNWYSAHPGKHTEYQKRYWLKKAKQLVLVQKTGELKGTPAVSCQKPIYKKIANVLSKI
jgi:hypothetical protein